MKLRIYLDNNGSTPIDSRVLEAIVNDLQHSIGNPSSPHTFGQSTRNQLSKARHTIASYLNVKPQEIIFTSGGTEALNLIIRGILSNKKNAHVISSNLEHSSVFSTFKAMEMQDHRITFLAPGIYGAPKLDEVKAAILPDTQLIALMAVNNETGVKTDIESIASFAHQQGIPFLVDGVALLGKESFKIPAGVSAICFSGHKLHAPKGIGFAFIRQSLKLVPQITGGEQEFNRRSGTENISGIVGLATAVQLLKSDLPSASTKMEQLRDRLENGILNSLQGVFVNGTGPRIVNTTNLAFGGVDGETLLTSLDLEGVAVSHGSACASGGLEPSRILLNMKVPLELARSSIRFSLSRFTTVEEIDTCIEIVVRLVHKLRKKV